MTNEIVKQDAQEVQTASEYKAVLEAFREQCAVELEKYKDHVMDASACADVIRTMPLPESSIQHKNMICMAECMDMVRSELIEMMIIDSSVPPMMIADAVVDKLKESAEALRKENEQLISALKLIESRISYYASLAEGGAPNIEQWAYTDQSGDIKLIRDLIAKVEGGAA